MARDATGKRKSSEDLENLRRSFMPPRVRLLFVGESPPAGGTFFYLGNSTLYKYTEEAFAKVNGTRANAQPSGFLNFFRDCGCYLDDLCLEPVNHLAGPDKRRACKASVPDLARRLASLRPDAVVAVKKTLDGDVRKALSLAGVPDLPLSVLPHPAFGNQKRYVEGLVERLRALKV